MSEEETRVAMRSARKLLIGVLEALDGSEHDRTCWEAQLTVIRALEILVGDPYEGQV